MTIHIGKHLIDPDGRECTVADFDGVTVEVYYSDGTWEVYLIDEIDETWKEK
jgi:hypothetical protein